MLQVATLYNWTVERGVEEATGKIRCFLKGYTTDHPRLGKCHVVTSTLQKIEFDEGFAVTQNTVYHLKGAWTLGEDDHE